MMRLYKKAPMNIGAFEDITAPPEDGFGRGF